MMWGGDGNDWFLLVSLADGELPLRVPDVELGILGLWVLRRDIGWINRVLTLRCQTSEEVPLKLKQNK